MRGKQLTGVVMTTLAASAWLTAVGCNGSSVGSNGSMGSVEGEATGGTSGSPTPPVTGSGGQSGVVTGEGTTDGGNSGPGGVPADCHSPPPPTKVNVWTEVPAPIGQTRFVVTDAFAVATDDLLFAGYVPNDADGTGMARIMRWTRGCWTVELELGHTGVGPHPSVHGTGPDNLWASAGQQLFHRGSGGWTPFDDSWKTMVHINPFVMPPDPDLIRVRDVGPDDVWVAESSNIMHFTGGAWSVFNFDDPNYPNESASIGFFFSDIWIDGPNDVFVSGSSDVVGNTMDPAFLHHWDGSAWTRFSPTIFGIPSIWRGGASLWLAAPGTTRTINGQDQSVTLFQHISDDTAPPVLVEGAQAGESLEIDTLWGRGANDLWGAGNNVAHFDGNRWAIVSDAPAPAVHSHNLEATFVTGDAHAVWLVAPGPRFFRNMTAP
jgi:hypothetical protein